MDIRNEILLAANSIIQSGIKPGDRIAVVGYNNTRYLSIDTAIGLTGAISVPLYYTSTTGMINEILKECTAKMIFIGRRSYLDELDIIMKDIKYNGLIVV
jgi:long-chain acyl-CoA synthetase